MSETFLIKNTTFDNSGSISEKSDNSFIIGVGELNGPNGAARNTDLQLHGFGSLKWGEGVNQNLYRLLESNACPQKEAGDFLQGTDDPNGFIPTTGSYNPISDPLLPKDERDLGIGNGITIPVIGQSWYNTSNALTYTFDGAAWNTVVNEDGSLSLSGLLDMGGFEIINLKDPIANRDAVNLQYVNDNYVNMSGDTMSGDLIMDITAQLTITNPGPVTTNDVANLGYNDSRYVKQSGDAMTGALNINDDLSVTGVASFSNTPKVDVFDVWHAGNDGVGSGLDADTVDGIHVSDLINLIYPLGSIYMSVNSTNPGSYPFYAGTTWVPYAEGLTIIGQEPGDLLFGSGGSTGGSANAVNVSHNHIASVTDPGHVHSVKKGYNDAANPIVGFDNATNYSANQNTESAVTGISVSISSVGVSGTNANLPPYIVTYMWKRTG